MKDTTGTFGRPALSGHTPRHAGLYAQAVRRVEPARAAAIEQRAQECGFTESGYRELLMQAGYGATSELSGSAARLVEQELAPERAALWNDLAARTARRPPVGGDARGAAILTQVSDGYLCSMAARLCASIEQTGRGDGGAPMVSLTRHSARDLRAITNELHARIGRYRHFERALSEHAMT